MFDGTFLIHTTSAQEAALSAIFESELSEKGKTINPKGKYTALAYVSDEPRQFKLVDGIWSLSISGSGTGTATKAETGGKSYYPAVNRAC